MEPNLVGGRVDGHHRSKKIGVLTFHRCINYGSYWQARCLVEGLRSRGHDAFLLDHVSSRINIAEWRCALRPTLPTPVSKSDSERYACKIRKFLAEFERLPLSAPFDIDHPERLAPMDAVVIGSDEVWNLQHPWYAGQAAFFGLGLPAERIVTYAASFGNYSCWEGIGSPWTDLLSRLDAIAVRDENSWWMLKNALGIEPETVLDPCLQFPPTSETAWSGPTKPFAVVYGHNFTPAFAHAGRRWADSRKLLLLSVGYRNDWADSQWIEAGPLEFAEAMRRCESVATNFFHGCVFALNNVKPFACEISPYRSIKVRGLMGLLGGEAHLVADGSSESVGALLSQPIADHLFERLQAVRDASDRYLSLSLETDA
ncbi:polysaccharide pyruvyl transferase family protein [Fimbriimonas ginsengisoli]|uniref:polysaccharide pyruvyl transferase family protein n=1 Tax=Fimbriimonas ginsengisoli TaxID=1005039 RepID=UPI001D0E082A|nr:polysaccharide pyruvyl transferase family protein [Fimbriimonas ginsengisoli]